MSNSGLDMLNLAAYFLPMLLLVMWYSRRAGARARASTAALDEARASGMAEPVSLHPTIDLNKCIGCAACVTVCPEMPEHQVLGIVRGKAVLVSPADCIGHGACEAACPVDAISLVFGSARRGVELPRVQPDFQTNVPGIFVAGELGGMGLIRNAVEQGKQAINNIANAPRGSAEFDVLIVGAGPAGIAAALAAKEKGLNYINVEQESLGGTVAHFPRHKLVMTAPADLPLVGKVRFKEISKEALLEFWEGVCAEHSLVIKFGERVEKIERNSNGFAVTTTRATVHAATILLAMGRRGTPRKLGVPGEELAKVTYRLIDAEQYSGQAVLVVGGGDSALEAACALAEVPGTRVSLSYRSAAFSRAKAKNRDKVDAAEAAGKLEVLLGSTVTRVGAETVELEQDGRALSFDNDAVIVNAGGILPSGFLKSVGVEVDTKFGTR